MSDDILNDPEHQVLPSGKPLITLAIFSYNQEDYIAEAIEGALAQTYSPLEIIISDDCSTDRTFDVIQATIKGRETPHHIRVNRNATNQGVAAHVNKVFEMAGGRLIVMNGGDDISLPTRTAEIYDAWLSYGHPCAIHSRWIEIDETGAEIASKRPPLKVPDGNVMTWQHPRFLEQIENAYLFQYTGAALAFDLKTIREVFSPLCQSLRNEDQVLYFRSCLTNGVVYLEQPLVKYRQHAQSLTGMHRDSGYPMAASVREREDASRKHRTQRMLHYRSYVADLDWLMESGRGDSRLQVLRDTLERRALVLEILSKWWSLSVPLRLAKLVEIKRNGKRKEIQWAIKRLMPWAIFDFFVSKPWRHLFSRSADIHRHGG